MSQTAFLSADVTPQPFLERVVGLHFFNTSRLDMKKLMTPQGIR